jgi:hypothetical protein
VPAGSTYSMVCSLWTVWREASFGFSDWVSVVELVCPGRLTVLVAPPPFCGRGTEQPVKSSSNIATTARAAMKLKVFETVNTATLSWTTERCGGTLRTTSNSECCIPWMQPLLKSTQRRSRAVVGLVCLVFMSKYFWGRELPLKCAKHAKVTRHLFAVAENARGTYYGMVLRQMTAHGSNHDEPWTDQEIGPAQASGAAVA